MKNAEDICPGCHKHCSLSSPRCKIGKEYAKTGLPADRNSHDSKKRDLEPDAVRSTTTVSAGTPSSDKRLTEDLRFVSRALRHEKGSLAPLSSEEKAQLHALLTKMRIGWNLENAGTGDTDQKKHGHHHHGGH